MYVHTKLSHMLKVVNPTLLNMEKILFLCQKSELETIVYKIKKRLSFHLTAFFAGIIPLFIAFFFLPMLCRRMEKNPNRNASTSICRRVPNRHVLF